MNNLNNLQIEGTNSAPTIFFNKDGHLKMEGRFIPDNAITELVVNWYFEEDDEDHYDTGQFFEEKLYRTKFVYQEVA